MNEIERLLFETQNFDISPEEVKNIFLEIDKNNDNKIQIEEFIDWWNLGKPNKLTRVIKYQLELMKILRSRQREFNLLDNSVPADSVHQLQGDAV